MRGEASHDADFVVWHPTRCASRHRVGSGLTRRARTQPASAYPKCRGLAVLASNVWQQAVPGYASGLDRRCDAGRHCYEELPRSSACCMRCCVNACQRLPSAAAPRRSRRALGAPARAPGRARGRSGAASARAAPRRPSIEGAVDAMCQDLIRAGRLFPPSEAMCQIQVRRSLCMQACVCAPAACGLQACSAQKRFYVCLAAPCPAVSPRGRPLDGWRSAGCCWAVWAPHRADGPD